MVAYAFKQQKIHEKNYSNHDLELTTMTFSLNIQKHYFYEVKYEVITDNHNLHMYLPIEL